ncbi:hypothetical protein ABK040_012094 [Willaertia magna]
MSLQASLDLLQHSPYFQQVLSTYQQIHSIIQQLDQQLIFNLCFLNHAFIIAIIIYKSLKSHLLDSSNNSNNKQQQNIPYVIGLLLCFALGTGGAILNALLLGEHQIYFDYDNITFYFICAWTLVIYSPFNIIYYLLGNFIIQLPLYLLEGYFISGFLMNAIDKGIKLYPNSIFAPIILGIVSVTGGGILKSYFINLYFGKSLENNVLSKPNFILKSILGLSLFYYISKYILDKNEYLIDLNVLLNVNLVIHVTNRNVIEGYFVVLYFYIYLLTHFGGSVVVVNKKKDSIVSGSGGSNGKNDVNNGIVVVSSEKKELKEEGKKKKKK